MTRTRHIVVLSLAALALALGAAASAAQESRGINPIARPQPASAPRAVLSNAPSGSIPVNPPLPVARARVEAAVNQIAAAWGERKLDGVLGNRFSDRQRLIDALETRVPRDAKLRVVSIQGWQVLEQYRLSGFLVSKLRVTVSTQTEFNDAARGYQVQPGTNDYVITLNDGGGS
jgi:hypothetical protein